MTEKSFQIAIEFEPDPEQDLASQLRETGATLERGPHSRDLGLDSETITLLVGIVPALTGMVGAALWSHAKIRAAHVLKINDIEVRGLSEKTIVAILENLTGGKSGDD